MKVQLDGKEYWIEFEYATTNHAGSTGQRELTRCIIRENNDRPPGAPAFIVAEAHVVRYFKDRQNREVARKAALNKAVHEFDATFCAYDYPNKARRKLFWDAYLNRKKAATAKAGQ